MFQLSNATPQLSNYTKTNGLALKLISITLILKVFDTDTKSAVNTLEINEMGNEVVGASVGRSL